MDKIGGIRLLNSTGKTRLLKPFKDIIKILKNNEIHNIGVVIVEVKTGEVKSYLGNTPNGPKGPSFGLNVNVIEAPRSTGSVLKPILHACMLESGELMPQQLIKDVPTYINGYNPKNFDKGFAGLIPADDALSKSLNVPAVYLFRNTGLKNFSISFHKLIKPKSTRRLHIMDYH